ncbi:MAG: transporter permease [Actinomycetia bacterium]|nr:transporter permease [Actinomycetes bacterium]
MTTTTTTTTDAKRALTPKQKYRRRQQLVYSLRILLAVVIVGGWELGARTKVIDPFFYGQPTGIYSQLHTWIVDGTAQGPLWKQVAVTLEETVMGFVAGVFGGVVCGIILGTNRLLADIFSPYIKAFNSIPRVVLGSIFTIAFGLGLTSKVLLAFVLVFFVVFFNAFQGVREVDQNLISNARILGAGKARIVREVTIPSALSWILASLHTSFGFALVGAVVGEFLGSTQGVGSLIQIATQAFNANGVFAAMTLLAVVALTAEALVTKLENRLVKWRPTPVSDITL